MSDYIYLYRLPASSQNTPDSPNQAHERFQKWASWFKDLEARGIVKNMGHPLASQGKVVKDRRGTVTDVPFTESKDIILGFSIIEARDLAHAAELAAGCPVFEYGGAVEVRPIRQM